MLLTCFALPDYAKQVLPEEIVNNTISITALKTGELGKNYFYCTNGDKCSTEKFVIEYYRNSGYKVMRAEHSFWNGIFILSFLDELYSPEIYKPYGLSGMYYDIKNAHPEDYEIRRKYKLIKKTNLSSFINQQIKKHENGGYIRDLDEWEFEGYKNPTEYFKSPIVQEFFKKIDNKTFSKVLSHILGMRGYNPLGTPDYIVWNDKEMIFVEVKRKNEKLSPEQIEWGEFLVKNKIPYKVVRVVGQ